MPHMRRLSRIDIKEKEMSGLLDSTIDMISPLDEKVMAAARSRQDQLTKPRGSLGRLELSIQLAGIQSKSPPRIKHGSRPTEVTRE